jgi:hypothetical protein
MGQLIVRANREVKLQVCPCIPFAAVNRENGMSEHTHEHKQVVFRYDGDDEDADVEVDILGDLPD